MTKGASDAPPEVARHGVLKERATALFDGLRDLPQYGQGLWENYFRRTFDAYNSLWKHQQEHRALLEAAGGLRRHEIGETASRIGQLYYLFYLRKGDTAYLDESFVFYDFIRRRRYFAAEAQRRQSGASDEGAAPVGSARAAVGADAHALALRELRYYARFSVVCFLTGRRSVLRELIAELRERVESIESPQPSPADGAALEAAAPVPAHAAATLSAAAPAVSPPTASSVRRAAPPPSRAEWELVLSEFGEFLRVERPYTVVVLGGALELAPPPTPPPLCQNHHSSGDVIALAAAGAASGASAGTAAASASEARALDECLPLRLLPQLTQPLGAIVAGFSSQLAALRLPTLRLAQAVLVGARPTQPKLAELPIDVFRALHTIEWDAAARRAAIDAGASAGALPPTFATPHKYLLHRPSVTQLLLVLATVRLGLTPLPCSSVARPVASHRIASHRIPSHPAPSPSHHHTRSHPTPPDPAGECRAQAAHVCIAVRLCRRAASTTQRTSSRRRVLHPHPLRVRD
jgi:hypothetical protein